MTFLYYFLGFLVFRGATFKLAYKLLFSVEFGLKSFVLVLLYLQGFVSCYGILSKRLAHFCDVLVEKGYLSLYLFAVCALRVGP